MALDVRVNGTKDILSITVGANESSKFWMGMLNDLKNRGMRDVLFFCVDGLSGFKEVIAAGISTGGRTTVYYSYAAQLISVSFL